MSLAKILTYIFVTIFAINTRAATPIQEFTFILGDTNYGIYINNDRFGNDFVSWMNLSLELSPNQTHNMTTIACYKTQEDSNFFILDVARMSATRFLGYFPVNGTETNALEVQKAIRLFNRTNQVIPAQAFHTASKGLSLVLYLPTILAFSFILHHIALPRLL